MSVPTNRRAAACTLPLVALLALLPLLALSACGGAGAARDDDSARTRFSGNDGALEVLAAGSLARPLRAALDSFTARTGIPYTLEASGSLELARRLTDLQTSADIVALADEEVFPRLLMPTHVSWYARFARNRLVLAHAPNARGLAEARGDGWRSALLRDGVDVGRSDPDLDPAGYRALMLFQLAERWYADPGLAQRLAMSSPRRHIRPKSAELVALLQAGELDYAWMYESTARGARLPFIALPPAIDLGDESLATAYHAARVRVLGTRMGDTMEVRGMPIRYGITIPRAAPHAEAAGELLRFLLSREGRAAMRAEFLDALEQPAVMGTGAPEWLAEPGPSTSPRAPSSAPAATVAPDSTRR
jgi:molybdate/tungstate transport system substrate-binding protein